MAQTVEHDLTVFLSQKEPLLSSALFSNTNNAYSLYNL